MTIRHELEQRKDYIVKNYQEGKSTHKLGKEFGCNAGTIWLFLKSVGVEVKKRQNYGKIKNNIDEVIKLYNEGLTCYQIAKRLNVRNASLVKMLNNYGYDTSRYSDVNKDNLLINRKDEVIKMYNDGISSTKIAKITGHSNSSVWHLLDDNGIKLRENRKYTMNHNFFDNIDTEDRAYILGFMYADGNVRLDSNIFRMFQTEPDNYILDQIKNILEYDGPIYRRERPSPRKPLCTLTITSKQCVKSLIEKGCVPAKSHILEFPDFNIVPKRLMNKFLLGMFDGDGSIKNSINRGYACSITSSDKFCEGLSIFLFCELGIQGQFYYRYKNQPERKCGSLMFTKKQSCKTFLDFLYKDLSVNSLYLKRKYGRYCQMFYNSISPHFQSGVATV